jgi:hypothetical protein
MRKIRLPRLRGLLPRATGRKRTPAPPSVPEPSYRGRTRAKYGPAGKPAHTRSLIEERATTRPPRSTGLQVTPTAGTPPISRSTGKPHVATHEGRRNYPAPQVANLRKAPAVRAGTRFQLAERHATLAKSRERKPPQGIGTLGARTQLANRPRHGVQAHTYPAPYERKKPIRAATAPREGQGQLDQKPVPHQHPARGIAARPPTRLPGDVTPTNRMGGSRAGADQKPHPFFSKRG